MKIKRLRFLSAIILSMLLCVALVGCASTGESGNSGDYGGGIGEEMPNENVEFQGLASVENRKIIYTASFTLVVDDLGESLYAIRSALGSGEWLDNEQVYSDYESAYVVVRVRSDRIDEFIDAISKKGTRYDFVKTATDISLEYANRQIRIDALNAEHARLINLLDNASLADMLTINARLSSIETELAQLQNELNVYDSRIDFSTVSIRLYKTYTPPTDENLTFGKRIATVFVGAFKALVEVFKFISIAIVAVFPFALIIVPASFGIAYLVKRNQKAANEKLAKKEKEKAEKESEGEKEGK